MCYNNMPVFFAQLENKTCALYLYGCCKLVCPEVDDHRVDGDVHAVYDPLRKPVLPLLTEMVTFVWLCSYLYIVKLSELPVSDLGSACGATVHHTYRLVNFL